MSDFVNLSNESTTTDGMIAEVVRKATLQVPGVYSFSARFYDNVVDEISKPFGINRTPGITIKHKKEGLSLHVYLILTLERNMITVGKEVQQEVYAALKLMLGIDTIAIHVRVEGIVANGEVS